MLLVIGLLVGLVIGRLLPPRRRRARARARLPGLLAAGVLLQVAGSQIDSGLGYAALLAGYGALVAFAVANLHMVGMGVLAIGLVANVVPILVNGGMPVRPEALVDAEIVDASEIDQVELDGHRHLEDDDDMFVVLADIIPVPWFRQVVSFGDLIVIVGAADVIAHLTRRVRRRAPVPAPARPPADTAEPTGPSLRYTVSRDELLPAMSSARPAHD